MRILHLLDQASPEANPGTLRVLQAACDAQPEHDHQVVLMGGTPLASYAEAAGLKQGRVIGVPSGRAANGAVTLAPLLEQLQPIDMIHAWSPACAAMVCARYARIPAMLTVCRALDESDRQQLDRARMLNSSLHLLVTHHAAALELAQVHWPADGITLAPLPVQPLSSRPDRPGRDALQSRWGGGSLQTKVGLLLCDCLPGPDASDAVLAVAVAEHILHSDGVSLKVLVHPDQTGRLRADRAAAELGHVHRLVSEPATLAPWLLTTGCDFALAVGQDGNVHSIVHAMAAGLPVIAERQSALAHLLEDEVTALLVPPNDPRAMGHAIQRVSRDEALAQRLREAARQRVATECPWDAWQQAVNEASKACAAGQVMRA